MSMRELYTLFARNWRCGSFVRSLYQGCWQEIRKKDVVMTAGRWSSWSIQISQFLMLWWHVMKAGSTAMTKKPRDGVPSGSMLALPDPRRPDRANPPTNFRWSLFWLNWVPTGQTVNKAYYVKVFREFRKRFRRKRQALFKSDQWHFNQHNAPVHNSILVTVYLTKMGIKTAPRSPYSSDLASCDFWSFPKLKEKLRLSLWDNADEERGCDEGHWHAHTRGLPSGLPEVVGTVEQVYCSRRRLLRRGLEFHVCTINKSAMRTKSGNLFNDSRSTCLLCKTHP